MHLPLFPRSKGTINTFIFGILSNVLFMPNIRMYSPSSTLGIEHNIFIFGSLSILFISNIRTYSPSSTHGIEHNSFSEVYLTFYSCLTFERIQPSSTLGIEHNLFSEVYPTFKTQAKRRIPRLRQRTKARERWPVSAVRHSGPTQRWAWAWVPGLLCTRRGSETQYKSLILSFSRFEPPAPPTPPPTPPPPSETASEDHPRVW